MRRSLLHRPAAVLWLVCLFALGAGVLPPVHRAQHAAHAAQTGDVDAACDLCAATLAAPLPAALPVAAPVTVSVVVSTGVVCPATPADVTATGRGPPSA